MNHCGRGLACSMTGAAEVGHTSALLAKNVFTVSLLRRLFVWLPREREVARRALQQIEPYLLERIDSTASQSKREHTAPSSNSMPPH